MDNKDISKIPVSELTPENIDSLKGAAPEEAKQKVERESKKKTSQPHSNSRLPIVIAGVALLIVVGVAIYFIFRKAPEGPTPSQDTPEDGISGISWESDSESDNPSLDYIKHHEDIAENPDSTADEKLESRLSIANMYSTTSEFDKAQSTLDSIDRTALSHKQTFNLYSAYAYLYECKGDSTLQQEYLDLGRAELERFWEDSEGASTESGE